MIDEDTAAAYIATFIFLSILVGIFLVGFFVGKVI